MNTHAGVSTSPKSPFNDAAFHSSNSESVYLFTLKESPGRRPNQLGRCIGAHPLSPPGLVSSTTSSTSSPRWRIAGTSTKPAWPVHWAHPLSPPGLVSSTTSSTLFLCCCCTHHYTSRLEALVARSGVSAASLPPPQQRSAHPYSLHCKDGGLDREEPGAQVPRRRAVPAGQGDAGCLKFADNYFSPSSPRRAVPVGTVAPAKARASVPASSRTCCSNSRTTSSSIRSATSELCRLEQSLLQKLEPRFPPA